MTFLRRHARRRRLPERPLAKCSRTLPDAAFALPNKRSNPQDCPSSRSLRTRGSFPVHGRESCWPRTRHEIGAVGHERPARIGLAKPSTPWPSTPVVWETCEERVGHLCIHPTWLHQAVIQSCLYHQRGIPSGGCIPASSMDSPQRAPVPGVAHCGRPRHLPARLGPPASE
jgi:hypothetical protein